MNILARALITVGATAAAGASLAAEPAAPFWASAAVFHRHLEEESATGDRLLTETGPMLQLRFGAQQPLAAGGAIAAEAMVAAGALGYDGQTQSGRPLRSTTRHRDAGARLMWRPVPAQSWGEPWFVLGLHHNLRNIIGTATASGLRESSSAVLAGVRWQSAPHPVAPGWNLRLELEAMISARHRLDVDFRGLYDATRLDGGRQRRATVRLVGAATQSPWDWTVEWSHLNQAVSPSSPLRRGGVAVGTVRQPRLTIDDMALRVTRRF